MRGLQGGVGGADDVADGVAGGVEGQHAPPPWVVNVIRRERDFMEWSDDSKARLIQMITAYELHLEYAEVEWRLHELAVALPGLQHRVASMRPQLLAGLICKGSGTIVSRLITLKILLPRADMSALAVTHPQIFLLKDLAELSDGVERLPRLLGIPPEEVDRLVQQQPRFLEPDLVEEVLQELGRLFHGSTDPRKLLVNDPTWLLRAERGQRRLGDNPDA